MQVRWQAKAGMTAVLALLGASEVALAQGVQAGGAVPASREACFDPTRVTSYAPLGGMFLYLQVNDDEHYLLTLDRLLADANRLNQGRPRAGEITITGHDLSTRIPRVCKDTWPQVAYLDAGEPVFRRVLRIEAVASKEAAQQLAASRRANRPKE
jgi:hypothetical protein